MSLDNFSARSPQPHTPFLNSTVAVGVHADDTEGVDQYVVTEAPDRWWALRIGPLTVQLSFAGTDEIHCCRLQRHGGVRDELVHLSVSSLYCECHGNIHLQTVIALRFMVVLMGVA